MIKSDIIMEDIINEGFEIIEEVYFAEIESPVQLKNIKDLKLSRLDYRTCDLNLEKKKRSLFKQCGNLFLCLLERQKCFTY